MATAEQIKSPIRSHLSDEPERFYTIALQVAAHEAKQGHSALAHDIRDLVDKSRRSKGVVVLRFPKDMLGLVLSEDPKTSRASLVISADLEARIERIIHEYRQQHKLKSHGLVHRRKVLLIGTPGTGMKARPCGWIRRRKRERKPATSANITDYPLSGWGWSESHQGAARK